MLPNPIRKCLNYETAFLLGSFAVLFVAYVARRTLGQEIKYKSDPNAAKKKALLLKDFDPKPMLHAATHEVPRAKCPVIDIHNHVDDAGGVHHEEIPPAEVVRRMDRANVRTVVILTGSWIERGARGLKIGALWTVEAPGRILDEFLIALVVLVDRGEECFRIAGMNGYGDCQPAAFLPDRVEPPIVNRNEFAAADEGMYASYFRRLETNDEYFPYWGYPGWACRTPY